VAKVIVDQVLRAKLHGLQEMIELYDEADRPVGCFLPLEEYWKLELAADQCPLTYEEVLERQQAKGARSLAEIWKELGQA
jgi:hypothetical protein